MRFVFVVGLIAALSSTAFADEPRSEGTAFQLSLTGALVPAAVFATGLDEKGTPTIAITALSIGVVTPSLGEIYAGRYVTYGMAARAAGFAFIMIGYDKFEPFCSWDSSCSETTNEHYRQLLLGGLVVYAGGVIYDVATAPHEARRYNARHVSIAPLVGPSNGVALSGQF